MRTSVEHHLFLRSRRSIRRFQHREIDRLIINRILESAFVSPSAHNRQPWRFAIISSLHGKKNLSDKMAEEFKVDLARDGLTEIEINKRLERSRDRIVNSPTVIVLCLDESEMDDYPDARRQHAESMMAIQSVAMAGLQLLLAAHAEGLGGVWTCGPLFAPDAVRTSLTLPPTWTPQALLLLGYPNEIPNEKKIKIFQDMVLFID
jgi:coenzyme F420-0:L-glutamate ligase/coenzyme F420-1:gamma-L-glutamate ligase